VRPELFRVLDTPFPAYFLLLVSGFVLATALGTLWARRVGEDPDVVVDLGLASLLMGVVGGRLLHVIADEHFWDYVHLCTDPSKVDWPLERAVCTSPRYGGVWDAVKGVCHPAEADCFAWAKFWNGGLAYYGGFVGASLGATWLLRRDRFPFWKAADMAGFAIPLGLGFGRMGCLLAGCCFGVPSSGLFGLSFPPRSPAAEAQARAGLLSSAGEWSRPVLATQILESALSFGIAALCLYVVHPKKRYDGQVFVAFMVLYAAGRFVLEAMRADERGGLGGLSTSQLIGLGLGVVAWLIHRRRARTGEVPAAEPA
jgi:phosphatidylglycerol:prolipoprotein diacylglycerol transferase